MHTMILNPCSGFLNKMNCNQSVVSETTHRHNSPLWIHCTPFTQRTHETWIEHMFTVLDWLKVLWNFTLQPCTCINDYLGRGITLILWTDLQVCEQYVKIILFCTVRSISHTLFLLSAIFTDNYKSRSH